MSAEPAGFRRRDGNSLVMLGAFFVVISLLVLCGVFWSHDKTSIVVVSLASGGILLLVGIAFVISGLYLLKSAPAEVGKEVAAGESPRT